MRIGAHQRPQPMVRFLLSLASVIVMMSSFLEGLKAALTASKDFEDGHYTTVPHHGLRAFGRVFSAWAYGQAVCIFCTFAKLRKLSDVRDSGSVRISTSVTDCECRLYAYI